MPSNENVIIVKDLCKKFMFVKALDGIDLTIARNEHCLLIGPNGSGKSTLIKVLLGLIKPTKGKVRVLGLNPFKEFRILKRRIGALLDDFNPPWWVSGYEFLKHVSLIKGIEWGKVLELAREFNVESYWHRLVGTYSMGIKRKIGLIQALMGNPELVILDDPFTGLDHESRSKLVEILREKSNEATIIVSTHMLFGLERIAKKAIILDGGKKIAEGGVDDVIKSALRYGIIGRL